METGLTFMQEATEWLKPLGYSVQFYSADKNTIVFSNVEVDYSPSISCSQSSGERIVQLSSSEGLKLFLEIKSAPLMFRHPDISRFINVMRHYTHICASRPPF